MTRLISKEDLRGLFTKPYGEDAPTKNMWSKFCSINIFDCLLSPSTVNKTSLWKYFEVSFLISFEVAGHFSDGFITAVFPAEKIFTNGFKT